MFRTFLRFAFVAAGATLLLAGCVTPDSQGQSSDLPEWYLSPPTAEDAVYGVGSAKMSTLDTARRTVRRVGGIVFA